MEYIRRSASASRRSTSNAVFGTERHANAQRDHIAPANMAPRLDGRLIQALGLFLRRFGGQPGSGNHKFVSAHARHIVVSAAHIFQPRGKFAQQFVAFQVPEGIVDLP